MSEAWLNFSIVVFVQLLLFLICAHCEKRLSDAPRTLRLGVLVGIAVGIPFDLLVGKFFGLHSFALGFGIFFLTINSVLSYGLFVANILLLQHIRLPYFILWNIAIVTLYETINNFFAVWTWRFTLPQFKLLIVLLVGYLAGAILVAIISHILLGRRFLFIDNLLNK